MEFNHSLVQKYLNLRELKKFSNLRYKNMLKRNAKWEETVLERAVGDKIQDELSALHEQIFTENAL